METLARFDPAGKLPLRLVMTEDITSVRLGINEYGSVTSDDPEMPGVEVKPLPAFTRFSLDGGESYYMLYEGAVAEFIPDSGKSVDLLMDFSYTGMRQGTGFLLAMDAYSGDRMVRNTFEATICGSAESVKSAVYEKESYLKSLNAVQTVQTEEQTEEKLEKSKHGYILNRDTVLVLSLPKEWQETDMEYTVELLTMAEDRSFYYKRIDPEASGLNVVHNDDEQRYEMVLSIGDRLPQAGTYRVNMEWSYEGICYVKKQTTFFINYAAHTEYSLSGLEVSKND